MISTKNLFLKVFAYVNLLGLANCLLPLLRRKALKRLQPIVLFQSGKDYVKSIQDEPMYSVSYDPLEPPSQAHFSRDLEDLLMERSLKYLDKSILSTKREVCYLVGLDDKSEYYQSGNNSSKSDMTSMKFTMEESLSELSELSGAAGLLVAGSTYQRVSRPNLEYYIGQGKTKDIAKTVSKLKCTCVIFDTELSPSQQKNLELALNANKDVGQSSKSKNQVKVIDRTALILDIFAQHARTREGQLQVQLAILSYRLPRLTNMWSHLERQSAGARGKSNGGVGLRGPGETQLESDKREMRKKISILNRAIDSVRRHRSMQRNRRKKLGLPVIALVGYTNAGKSTLLNALASAGVYTADMLFATLDPTTRVVRIPGMKCPEILVTDTVGFISKLPTNLIAAFRATLEEITEADILLNVVDVSNDGWRKQEAAVLKELTSMGLANKPIVTVWNKIDLIPDRKKFFQFEARKRQQTVALSGFTGEGLNEIVPALESALVATMEFVTDLRIDYSRSFLLDSIHRLGIVDEVSFLDDTITFTGKLPRFLVDQILSYERGNEEDVSDGFVSELENIIDGFAEPSSALRTVNQPIDAAGSSTSSADTNDWDFSHYDSETEYFLEEDDYLRQDLSP